MNTPVVVIVPFRDRGDPARAANLKHVLAHLTETGWPVLVCSDDRPDAEPFCRSAAYNNGVTQARADVYVFHEADMLVAVDALEDAAMMAGRAPGLVVPFDVYRYLSEAKTAVVREGRMSPFDVPFLRRMKGGTAVGAVNVVSSATMAAVGCWDEVMQGWGFDDRAMCRAFQIATGRPTRYVIGPAVHMWHEPGWNAGGRFAGGSTGVGPREVAATEANAARYRRYLAAETPEQIRVLTAGG